MSTITIGFDLGGTNLRARMFRGLAQKSNHDATLLPLAQKSNHDATLPLAQKSSQTLSGDSQNLLATTSLASHREHVDGGRSPQEICERIANVTSKLICQSQIEATNISVGIAFAGMLCGHRGDVANSPHYGWRDVPFGDLLRDRLGKRYQVSVVNDVNAAAYGEYAAGKETIGDDVLALFVGTGIGAGVICSGRLLLGSTNTAAELGHVKVRLKEDARMCACGLRGCIEAYVGGNALQTRVREELQGQTQELIVTLAGRPEAIHPGHIDEAARRGDAYALRLYSELSPMLALVLANAATLLNPKTIVLGGGMLSQTPVFRNQLIQAFQAIVNPPALRDLQIINASLGDDACLLGAALLASETAED